MFGWKLKFQIAANYLVMHSRSYSFSVHIMVRPWWQNVSQKIGTPMFKGLYGNNPNKPFMHVPLRTNALDL
jgi:hypothetical protein